MLEDVDVTPDVEGLVETAPEDVEEPPEVLIGVLVPEDVVLGSFVYVFGSKGCAIEAGKKAHEVFSLITPKELM